MEESTASFRVIRMQSWNYAIRSLEPGQTRCMSWQNWFPHCLHNVMFAFGVQHGKDKVFKYGLRIEFRQL